MRDDRRTAAELEFLLDQILTVPWKSKLTREAAFESWDAQRPVASYQLSQADPD
jgi:hypothetical protein